MAKLKDIDLSALMVKAQDGDEKAYRTLLVHAKGLVERFLASRVFDKTSIDDITQIVLMSIHKARHTYDPDQPFENWMYGIARFKLIDYIRKHSRKTDNEFATDKFEVLNVTEFNPATNEVSSEVAGDLEKALEIIPKKQRILVIRTKIEGHSVAEVAKEFDMGESAVKVSVHRSLKKMQTWLAKNGYA